MTLTTGLWSTSSAMLPASAEQEAMRRCAAWHRSLDPVELALPARALRDSHVAKWARDHALVVEVHNGGDLATAIGTGIHPMRLVVHAGGVSGDELVFCSANLGGGRVVANTPEQVRLLVSCAVRHRRQRVVLGTTTADVVTAVLTGPRLDLVGVYREIGSSKDCFTEAPEVVGEVIAEMARIRKAHAVVLTRVWVGGGGFGLDAGPDDLAEPSRAIEMTVDDACATLRFPRPLVVVSAGPGGPH
ncbi:LysA protein [Mycolicibacterium boenickei]|uniref:LysA protein n=1 Tax=Mycolicibacterium boenickei TaxID=146017 RepID=UPI001F439C1D|nr:LysA protein [Mycolicibacterium boenickei]